MRPAVTVRRCDVLIVGAGAAGLAAATALGGARGAVEVLEARDRIGGRIWTRPDPQLPIPLELGAEFIHGRAAAVFELLRTVRGAAVDATDSHWLVRDGKPEDSSGRWAAVHRLLQRVPEIAPDDLSVAEFLERVGLDGAADAGRRFIRTLVEGFDAADPARASVRAIAEEWTSALDAPQFRPLGGYGPLLERLAGVCDGNRIRLHLRSVLHTLQWRRGAVEAHGTSPQGPFTVKADRAIVTVPLSILQLPAHEPSAIRFEPALEDKRAALDGLTLGPVVKLLLRFRAPFWESLGDERLRDAAFFHAPDAAFPTFWSALPVRVPMLTAWAGGPRAAAFAGASAETLLGHALDSLGMIFGSRELAGREIEAVHVHDWQTDLFARGAYSYVNVGGAKARGMLAQPVANTLFFAGEATDTAGDAGTVAAALRSGTRAAREVLDSLR